jgi:RNA polymerase sigma-70 factor (ECF subfamily)
VGVDQVIAAVRTAGSAAWPTVAVSATQLRTHLDAVTAPPTHPADVYLVVGCLANLPAAFEAFEASQMSVVDRVVRKVGGTADDVDEVKQHVRTVALVAKAGVRGLAGYRGDGPLASWIRVVAMREAYRRLRARKASPESADDHLFELVAAADPEADAEELTMKESYREQFRAAFRAAVAALPRRERAALRFNVVEGLSIDELAAMYSVHRATVARWIAHAREEVLRATRTAMMTELGVAESELASIFRLIDSRLDASIATAV